MRISKPLGGVFCLGCGFWPSKGEVVVDQFVRRLFRDEIEMQCKFVLLGAVRLDQAEAELTASPSTQEEWMAGKRRNPSEPLTRIWLALQDILVSAANISKLLWGRPGGRAAEREDLRSLLRISDSSPLRSPDLRNDFEDFDERIERHFSS